MSEWWSRGSAEQATLAALMFPAMGEPDGACDWDRVGAIAADHRLGPWLHAADAQAPEELKNAWADAARAEMVGALHRQHVLGECLDALEGVGLAATCLKGLPLSQFAYPQSWQRPMRDLDLLMGSAVEALEAWRTLVAAGWAPFEETGDPAALLGERHQLPPIFSPDGSTWLELHLRLFHGKAEEQSLHASVVRQAFGRDIRVLTPEAQLLHLVGHAGRDHRFDNGPQILVDLAMLWQADPIDVDRLFALAGEVRLERHCALLLRMSADVFPQHGIALPAFASLPDGWESVAGLAWQAMTSSSEDISSARDRLETRGRSTGAILARLFPSPARLAQTQGQAESPAALIGQYVAHYRRLATERLPRMVDRGETDDDLAALIDWLEP